MTEREQLIHDIDALLNCVHRVSLLKFIFHMVERILDNESIPH